MAKKNNRRASPAKIKKRKSEPSYWMVVAFIAVAFAVGLTVKIALSPQTAFNSSAAPNYSAAPTKSALDSQIKLVTANFKCACGGCGELPLIDCTCDMPRGAVEEKDFIRKKLNQGMSVDQVIQEVERVYGHRIT
jgi:hypothetical protein